MGVQGIDRERAASLELALAGAAGALTRAAADVADAMRWADVCDDTSGRLRRVVEWLDQSKHDLERRAYLIDVPDGAYGPFLPSMLVLPGPLPASPDPLDELFAGSADRYATAGPVNWSIDGVPEVLDVTLRNTLLNLYRPWKDTSIGSGSTPDALRAEIETGVKVGSRYHLQKALESLQSLIRVYTNPKTDRADQEEALRAIDDVTAALRSGSHPDLGNVFAKVPALEDVYESYILSAQSAAGDVDELATVAGAPSSLLEQVGPMVHDALDGAGGLLEEGATLLEEGLEELPAIL